MIDILRFVKECHQRRHLSFFVHVQVGKVQHRSTPTNTHHPRQRGTNRAHLPVKLRLLLPSRVERTRGKRGSLLPPRALVPRPLPQALVSSSRLRLSPVLYRARLRLLSSNNRKEGLTRPQPPRLLLQRQQLLLRRPGRVVRRLVSSREVILRRRLVALRSRAKDQ